MSGGEATERLRRLCETYASRYDRDTDFYDRLLLGDGRSWVYSQAIGSVLEVAIGTGRNLPFYADRGAGFIVEAPQRRRAGVMERLRASKPT